LNPPLRKTLRWSIFIIVIAAIGAIVWHTTRPAPVEVVIRPVGEPAEAIVTIAREIDAPLIICGTTGKGAVARTLLGSVSHELVHKSGAIVMSVP